MRGQPSHAAYPHEARDAIAALCQIIVNLQQVSVRTINPLHGHVLSLGYIQAGSSHNALPGAAEAGGTFRTRYDEDRQTMRVLLDRVTSSVAHAWGCEGTVEITPGEPAVVNDGELTEAVRTRLDHFSLTLGEEMRSLGSDDFGFFGQAAPILMLFVGVKGALIGPHVPLHHPRFLPDDQVVGAVARAYLAALLGAADRYGRSASG